MKLLPEEISILLFKAGKMGYKKAKKKKMLIIDFSVLSLDLQLSWSEEQVF